MVIDHIVYDVTVTRVVLHGFYPEKSPFFIFGMSLGESWLFSGQFELQANEFSCPGPFGWLLNGKVEWLHLTVMVLSII